MHSHCCLFETACVSTFTYIQAVRGHGVIQYTCTYLLVEQAEVGHAHTDSVAAGPPSAQLCIHWGSCTDSPNAAES